MGTERGEGKGGFEFIILVLSSRIIFYLNLAISVRTKVGGNKPVR